MNTDSIEKAVEDLIKRLKEGAVTGNDALKYTQAVCNLANARACIKATDKE